MEYKWLRIVLKTKSGSLGLILILSSLLAIGYNIYNKRPIDEFFLILFISGNWMIFDRHSKLKLGALPDKDYKSISREYYKYEKSDKRNRWRNRWFKRNNIRSNR